MTSMELKTKDEIMSAISNYWHDNDDTKLPPMFHGTDTSLIGLSESDRNQLYNVCETIIYSLVALYDENSVDFRDKRLRESRDSYNDSSNAYYLFAKSRINKSPYYSYGNYYVSNDPERAITYSKEAWIFGETGWVANRLIEGAKALELKLPDGCEFRRALEVFTTRKLRRKDPVVLMTVNANASELCWENGEKCLDNKTELRRLKGGSLFTISYRLNLQNMDADINSFAIKEAHYPELLDSWRTYKEMKREDGF